MKFINAYIFQSYLTCPREAWLEYHSINAEQNHEFLMLGRLIHETTYKRDRKEIFIDQLLKIDLVHGELVAEVKKSSRHKEAARMQLLYYLYYLKHEKGLEFQGMLLFPKERRREEVKLTKEAEEKIEQILQKIQSLVESPAPPPVKKIKYCKTCAFYDYCFAEEE